MKGESKRNPWQTIDRQHVYENNWIRVQHHEVLNPAGNLGIYGVLHFKNIAIGILPIDDHGYTWIVGQYRYVLDQFTWEIPEGGCPHGEDPLLGAQRELTEETGLHAKKWTKILEMQISNSVTDEVSISYIAEDLTFGAANPEETEDLEVRRLHFNELFEMVMQGKIEDALSVATVLRAKMHFDQTDVSSNWPI